jgi:hypothetical protein
MSDLISRQALMKEFADFVRKSNNSDFAQTPTWNDAVSLVGSMPSAQPDTRLKKIADLVDGSIDHFDLEDAMDLLYQIKEVLK